MMLLNLIYLTWACSQVATLIILVITAVIKQYRNQSSAVAEAQAEVEHRIPLNHLNLLQILAIITIDELLAVKLESIEFKAGKSQAKQSSIH